MSINASSPECIHYCCHRASGQWTFSSSSPYESQETPWNVNCQFQRAHKPRGKAQWIRLRCRQFYLSDSRGGARALVWGRGSNHRLRAPGPDHEHFQCVWWLGLAFTATLRRRQADLHEVEDNIVYMGLEFQTSETLSKRKEKAITTTKQKRRWCSPLGVRRRLPEIRNQQDWNMEAWPGHREQKRAIQRVFATKHVAEKVG